MLYHSPNSPASEQTKEFLTSIAKEFDTLKFGIVNAEDVAEASLAHKIVAVPTVLFFIVCFFICLHFFHPVLESSRKGPD